MKSPYTGSEMTLHTKKARLKFRGEYFEVDRIYFKCPDTGEEFANWWNNLDDRQRKVITDLPNFDEQQFKRITGIDINQPQS